MVRKVTALWLGEGVRFYNQTTIAVRSRVCVGQGAWLFAGNHDRNDPCFRFVDKPVRTEDGA